MARTNRNNAPVIILEPTEKTYRTALYVRLSVEDNNRSDDNDSTRNQEALLRGYIENKPCFVLHSVYVDNGETGVNFERDHFERLIDDVKNGDIDCIIVKDLSRFGRNYIEAGEYLEKIFPVLGIRFIAVNDGYDNIDPASSDELFMHLKNLVNDVYARDISHKICPVLRAKQERGEFIGAWAAYGYLKSVEDKHRLVVDEETAPIVRDMFAWRLMGLSYQAVTRKLTELSIPSPSKYRFNKGLVKDKRFENSPWRIQTVKQILSNQVYLGHMVQGRKRESLFNGQKQTLLPKDEWIIVENTHEAIIDQQTFDAVQQIGEESLREYNKKAGKFDHVGNSENILKGIAVCGCCGTRLIRYKNVRVNKWKEPKYHVWYNYICPAHTADPSRCSFLSIKETDLRGIVFEYLQSQFAVALDMDKLLQNIEYRTSVMSEEERAAQQIEQTKQRIIRIQRLRECLYDDYLDHLMNERDYLYSQNRYKEKETALNEHLAEFIAEQKHIRETKTEENPQVKALLNFCDNPELTKNMVSELIDKIIVQDSSHAEVWLRYRDEYELLQSRLSSLEVAANE